MLTIERGVNDRDRAGPNGGGRPCRRPAHRLSGPDRPHVRVRRSARPSRWWHRETGDALMRSPTIDGVIDPGEYPRSRAYAQNRAAVVDLRPGCSGRAKGADHLGRSPRSGRASGVACADGPDGDRAFEIPVGEDIVLVVDGRPGQAMVEVLLYLDTERRVSDMVVVLIRWDGRRAGFGSRRRGDRKTDRRSELQGSGGLAVRWTGVRNRGIIRI